MGEPHAAFALKKKRDEISGVIAHYERLLREAQHDLAHVNAALRLFDATGEIRPDGVRYFQLSELEAAYPQLLSVKAGRTTIEYYYTCTPLIVEYVMARAPQSEFVAYLDSDL